MAGNLHGWAYRESCSENLAQPRAAQCCCINSGRRTAEQIGINNRFSIAANAFNRHAFGRPDRGHQSRIHPLVLRPCVCSVGGETETPSCDTHKDPAIGRTFAAQACMELAADFAIGPETHRGVGFPLRLAGDFLGFGDGIAARDFRIAECSPTVEDTQGVFGQRGCGQYQYW